MNAIPLRAEDRGQLRAMLEGRRPVDARAAYYALHHPAQRVRLWIQSPGSNREQGFLVRAQTGQDLFRPLVILRASSAVVAEQLIQTALPPGSPFLLSAREEASRWPLPIHPAEPPVRLHLLELVSAQFDPVINIFVVRSQSPDGLPRYEIRHGERLLAAAGINWQSPEWAEIFVHTEPVVQNRGYGKSVVSALCRQLMEEHRRVLYAIAENNTASRLLAESIGFADSGECEWVLHGTMAEEGASHSRVERLA
jgi:RimJ/RimL family protein N-acetyltransferase